MGGKRVAGLESTFFVCFGLVATPASVHGLLVVSGPYGVLGIEPMAAACKANTLICCPITWTLARGTPELHLLTSCGVFSQFCMAGGNWMWYAVTPLRGPIHPFTGQEKHGITDHRRPSPLSVCTPRALSQHTHSPGVTLYV